MRFLSSVAIILCVWLLLVSSSRRGGSVFDEISSRFSTSRSLCVPTAAQYLEKREGRHACAYDAPGKFRAVGVGYNLDENPQESQLELLALALDYQKVYDGEQCLNNFQITTLLVVTSKRTLDLAAKKASTLDEWCCDVQKVFADVALTCGNETKVWEKDLGVFVEKASAHLWKDAAMALDDTRWCSKFQKRCKHAIKHLKKGCKDDIREA